MHEWVTFLETTLNNNFTFSVIFVLGMFHALEPGHGKTLILAYMTGGSMRFFGASQLIAGLILVHFLLFSFLAFLLKTGNDSFPILGTIGPSFIICLGLYLLYRASKEVRHEHDDDCDEPMHFHFNESKFSSPFVTGMVAGLIPCPSAVAVLLIASNKFSNDSTTLYSNIFVYVLGIALTLIGIMVLFLLFKERFSDRLNSMNKRFNTNLIAASLIILIGILYLALSLFGGGHQH
ncbi:MAG: cytochrome c biogenesis protein CcdA [Candidatus Marinimicrobia bacterium]|nr:cytochrome c biogenesis protein CcdA [Candidatus Neomarinimicrobiota bacterium]